MCKRKRIYTHTQNKWANNTENGFIMFLSCSCLFCFVFFFFGFCLDERRTELVCKYVLAADSKRNDGHVGIVKAHECLGSKWALALTGISFVCLIAMHTQRCVRYEV